MPVVDSPSAEIADFVTPDGFQSSPAGRNFGKVAAAFLND
jgi:hypothetical protein